MAVPEKKHFRKRDILIFYQAKNLTFLFFIKLKSYVFAGHIKVVGGLHLARGPDVVQAWFS